MTTHADGIVRRGLSTDRASASILLAYSQLHDEQRAILRGLDGKARVRFCTHADELVEAIRTQPASAVLVEWTPETAFRLRAIVDAIRSAATPIPILIRCSMSRQVALDILSVSPLVLDLRISLRGYDDVSVCAAQLLLRHDALSARSHLVARVTEVSPPLAVAVIATAAIVGERCSTVRCLADVCHMPVRSLEHRLSEAGVVPAKRVLLWMVALHAAWRRERLCWSSKRTSAAAGCRASRELTARVRRVLGVSVADLGEHVRFDAAFDQFAKCLTRPSTAPVLKADA